MSYGIKLLLTPKIKIMEIVLLLSKKNLASVAEIRCKENIFIAEENEHLWLKAINQENFDIDLKKIPSLKTYFLKENYLFEQKNVIPSKKIPLLRWYPVTDFIRPDFSVSLPSGQNKESYSIKIIKSDKFHDSDAILTDLSTLKIFANSAPEIRLKKLLFAVSNSGKVIIVGNPLPSIPGNDYWLNGNLLLPCGYDFEIPVISSFISDKLDPQRVSYIIFDKNGDWQRIFRENFVTMTRSGIRLTRVGLNI